MPPGKARPRSRPNWLRRIPTRVKIGTAFLIPAVGALTYSVSRIIHERRIATDPATYMTDRARELEAAGRFHDRDLEMLRHERLYGPAFDPHAEVLKEIAGDSYNIHTVISILGDPKRQILSERHVGYELGNLGRTMSELDASLEHQNQLLGAHWATEEHKIKFRAEIDGLTKQKEAIERRMDIIRRAGKLRSTELNPLLKTIHENKIWRARELREILYDGGWEKATRSRTSSRVRPRGQYKGRERRPDVGGARVAARAGPLRRPQHRG